METVELNADFTKRAAVHGARTQWQASPMQGVDRRMIERMGDEVARATTIVRFAPESEFSAHVHTGGEEFLVLDGVFQDEHDDFPTGSYVRNPPQSSHTPRSDAGCVIFVKLWQFEASDRTHVHVDINAGEMHESADREGVMVKPLFDDGREVVRMEHWQAGQNISYEVDGGIEIFVISGSFEESGDQFEEHSWLRLPVGQNFNAVVGLNGAYVWLKERHLASLHREAYAHASAD